MAGECNAEQYLIKMRKNFPLSINIYKFMYEMIEENALETKNLFIRSNNAIQVILVGDNA